MIIIGARPSMGKSMMTMQWLDCAAAQGVKTMIISEEMSAMQLAKRSMQVIMPVDVGGWASDLRRVNFEVQEHFATRAPLTIVESCGSIDAAERAIARGVKQLGIQMVAVDYAQLLKGDGHSRYDQVSDVSSRMKRVATKHKIVVLLLAQLNRATEGRPDPTPLMSDLKGSGQLEQDADVILFLFWPSRAIADYPDPNEYRIYQAKNRNRGIGTAVIEMRINAARQTLSTSSTGTSPPTSWSRCGSIPHPSRLRGRPPSWPPSALGPCSTSPPGSPPVRSRSASTTSSVAPSTPLRWPTTPKTRRRCADGIEHLASRGLVRHRRRHPQRRPYGRSPHCGP
jgi:KaiC/GvpD/RAD55 family RecA-like ATPase